MQGDIHPEDLKTLEDFRVLPFLTREDVNAHLHDLVTTKFHGKLRPNQTGGSTGQPIQFFTEATFWRNAVLLRGRLWYGLHEGEKIAWVWGALRDIPQWSWQRQWKAVISGGRYLNAFSMTEANMQDFAQMLVRWQPAMFIAYPSALHLFAGFLRERGIKGIHPRLIETTAEKITGPQRELVEEVFQCPIADCYASREFGTMAYQCEAGKLHVCEPCYLEIVSNGRAVGPGQLGEVVITSLNQFAMPFIRYKIDDMGSYESDPCPCGRGLPVLFEIVGRTGDFLVTDEGLFVHDQYFAHLFRLKPEIANYQVYQADRRHLEVKLVCRQLVGDEWLKGVQKEIENRFGKSMLVSLKVVDRIELTKAGKHRFVISEVKPGFA
jgi:phenylacetate-CoA ligase